MKIKSAAPLIRYLATYMTNEDYRRLLSQLDYDTT